MKQIEMMGLYQRVIEYETEDHSLEWIVQLFADLIATGLAWKLQGRYGREASDFIREEIIDCNGNVDWDYYEENYAL